DELKAEREDLMRTLKEFDARIDQLESEIRGPQPESPKSPEPPPAGAPPSPALANTPAASTPPELATAAAPTPAPVPVSLAIPPAPPPEGAIDFGSWGTYEPGRGFVFIRGKNGEIGLSLISYARYLNQLGLDKTYTDAFGRTKTLDLRQ